MFLFRKLSKGKIFSKAAVHTKNATLGGTLTFQILLHGKLNNFFLFVKKLIWLNEIHHINHLAILMQELLVSFYSVSWSLILFLSLFLLGKSPRTPFKLLPN
jgi:hypothetical protein